MNNLKWGNNDMVRINSNWYTKGKFDRKNWRNTLDTENEFLYSKGRYPTKIKKEDLPSDYVQEITDVQPLKKFPFYLYFILARQL